MSTIKYKSGINISSEESFLPRYQEQSCFGVCIGALFILSNILMIFYFIISETGEIKIIESTSLDIEGEEFGLDFKDPESFPIGFGLSWKPTDEEIT